MIDTHAHLNDKVFLGQEEQYISLAKEQGVNYIINVGWNLPSSKHCATLSDKFLNTYFVAGVHPSDCQTVDNGLIDQLLQLSKHKKALAIGEIGLDYHYGKGNEEAQKIAFDAQIKLAHTAGLPFVVHSREASKDMADILRANKNLLQKGFLMHCYSESLEQAKIYLDLGGYFAFGGAITFKNAKKDEIIKYIPKDRLLCETDCPYMAPVPHRGSVNHPALVSLVYQKMEQILDISHEEFKKLMRDNAQRLFYKMKLQSDN